MSVMSTEVIPGGWRYAVAPFAVTVVPSELPY